MPDSIKEPGETMRESDLLNAKRVKNNEFNTLMTDIEAELPHYNTLVAWARQCCRCPENQSEV